MKMKLTKTFSDCLISNINTTFYLNLNSVIVMVDETNVNLVAIIISKFGFLSIFVQNLTMNFIITPKSSDIYLFQFYLGNMIFSNSTIG